jgi:SAM-dependent methyltransferase
MEDLTPKTVTGMSCTMDENGCCIVPDMKNDLDWAYWDNQWAAGQTGWDIGFVAPALKEWFDSIADKNVAILIPGCGNAHEAEYLLNKGFNNITVIEIAPSAVRILKEKFKNRDGLRIIEGDFFKHEGEYDIIVEQTFFCALDPSLRENYCQQMAKLLKKDGILGGLLFDRTFEQGPPFGGCKCEYTPLFHKSGLEVTEMNITDGSIPERMGTELFFKSKSN